MISLKLVNHQAPHPNWASGNKSMIVVERFVMINRVLRIGAGKALRSVPGVRLGMGPVVDRVRRRFVVWMMSWYSWEVRGVTPKPKLGWLYQ